MTTNQKNQRQTSSRRDFLLASGATLASIAMPKFAHASNGPTRIIVPYGAGGGIDFAGRLFADALRRFGGREAMVENRTGAGGMIGIRHVAVSKPDGLTIGVGGASPLILSKLSKKDLPFDPDDLEMAASLGGFGMVVAVRPDSPFKSYEDLVEHSKKVKDKFNIGSSQTGTAIQMALEYLVAETGLAGLGVPFGGDAEIVRSLVGGQVDMGVITLAGALPLLDAGKIKALAITSEERSSRLPSTPTIKELGFPDFSAEIWVGVILPKGTPTEIQLEYNDIVNRVWPSPEFRDRLQMNGIDFTPRDLAAVKAFRENEKRKWKRVAEVAGVEPI